MVTQDPYTKFGQTQAAWGSLVVFTTNCYRKEGEPHLRNPAPVRKLVWGATATLAREFDLGCLRLRRPGDPRNRRRLRQSAHREGTRAVSWRKWERSASCMIHGEEQTPDHGGARQAGLGSIRGRREVTLQSEPVLVTGGTGWSCSRIIDLVRKEESAKTVAVDNMVRQSKNLAASLGPSAVRRARCAHQQAH